MVAMKRAPIKVFVRGTHVNLDSGRQMTHVELRPGVDAPTNGRRHILERVPARQTDL